MWKEDEIILSEKQNSSEQLRVSGRREGGGRDIF